MGCSASILIDDSSAKKFDDGSASAKRLESAGSTLDRIAHFDFGSLSGGIDFLNSSELGKKLNVMVESLASLANLPFVGPVLVVATGLLKVFRSVQVNKMACFEYILLATKVAKNIAEAKQVLESYNDPSQTGLLQEHIKDAATALEDGLNYVKTFQERNWLSKAVNGTHDVEMFERCESRVLRAMRLFFEVIQLKSLASLQSITASLSKQLDASEAQKRRDAFRMGVNLTLYSQACNQKMRDISMNFLRPVLAERLKANIFQSNNFVNMQILQDEQAMQTLMYCLPGVGKAGDEANQRQDTSFELLCSHMCRDHRANSPRTQILFAAAGFGKSVLLKYLAIRINEHAAENPRENRPLAFFVRADHLCSVLLPEGANADARGTLDTASLLLVGQKVFGMQPGWKTAFEQLLDVPLDEDGKPPRAVVLLVDALDELPTPNTVEQLLFALRTQDGGQGKLRLSWVVVSTRPGALFEKSEQGIVDRPVVRDLNGLQLVPYNDAGAERYLMSLCTASQLFEKRDPVEHCRMLRNAITEDRSPLLLLLAFAASVDHMLADSKENQNQSAAQFSSRYQLYLSICTTAVSRKILERLTARNPTKDAVQYVSGRHKEMFTKLINAVDRLLAFYAIAIRLGAATRAEFDTVPTIEQELELIVGPVASKTLKADVDDLCETLGVAKSQAGAQTSHDLLAAAADDNMSPLSSLLEQLSGFLAPASSLWPFVHKSFEEFYCGLFLSNLPQVQPRFKKSGGAIFAQVFAHVQGEVSVADTTWITEPVWRTSMEMAASHAGPHWVIETYCPTILARLSSESAAAGAPPPYSSPLVKKKTERAHPLTNAELQGFFMTDEGTLVLKAASDNASQGYLSKLLSPAVGLNINGMANGRNALHRFSLQGDVAVVKLLLDHDADPTILDRDARSPLLLCSLGGHTEVAKLLLPKAPELLDQPGSSFLRTPLMHAARSGHVELCEYFLQNQPRCDPVDSAGLNFLMHACGSNTTRVVTLALKQLTAVVDLADKQGMNALMHAAMHGFLDAVQLLAPLVADVNAVDKFGRTALIHAARGGHLSVFRFLASHPLVDMNAVDNDKNTALLYACKLGHVSLVRFTTTSDIVHQIDTSLLPHTQETALFWALKNTVPKSDEKKRTLLESVKKNLFFATAGAQQLEILVDALKPAPCPPGEVVLREGAQGDLFYVIESGELDVFKIIGDTPFPGVKVAHRGPGESFGELALREDKPRAASIIAVTHCDLWSVDRETFLYVDQNVSEKRAMYMKFLDNVLVLSACPPYERYSIADALKEKKYAQGDVILEIGDTSDQHFYMVLSGTCDAYKILGDRAQPTLVHEYKQGEFFGELAMFEEEQKPRAARVVAGENCACLLLDKKVFRRELVNNPGVADIVAQMKQQIAIYQDKETAAKHASPRARGKNPNGPFSPF